MSVALTSTTGKPARTPEPSTLLTPFSTPGIYSFGTAPPTTFDSNEEPAPGSAGSNTSFTLANWPEPPDCFLWV